MPLGQYLGAARIFHINNSGTTSGITTLVGGLTTFNGDASSTAFQISHGIGALPTRISVDAASTDAQGPFYVSASMTSITVNYNAAPISGVSNVALYWLADTNSLSLSGVGTVYSTSGVFTVTQYFTGPVVFTGPVSVSGTITGLNISGLISGITSFVGGLTTFNGDASSTTFQISHGVGSVPTRISVDPASVDAIGPFYVSASTTSITVNYITARPSGASNVALQWMIDTALGQSQNTLVVQSGLVAGALTVSGTTNFAGSNIISGTTGIFGLSGLNWTGLFTSGGVSGGSGASYSGMIPQGYLNINVSGSIVKIPFFN